MKVTYKSILMGLLLAGMFAGCSSKDVEYDGASSADQTKVDTDNKLDQIDGSSEQSVDDDMTNVNNGVDSDLNNDSTISNGINSVISEIDGKKIKLNSVHFAFDKYVLSSDMREIATQNASTINNVITSYNNLKIKLEGNCDEWGTDEYNYALGLKRAKASKDALIADGIQESRITLISFGESNPVCTNRDVTCWKMNRRVDYKLLP